MAKKKKQPSEQVHRESIRQKRIAQGEQMLRDMNLGFSREDSRLGAAIIAMIAAIALFKEADIDPVATCQALMDDDHNEQLIGRRLFDKKAG